MVEKELEIDGCRSLGLIGDECLVTYSEQGEFMVAEKNLFSGSNKSFKVFKCTEDLANRMNTYILSMGYETNDMTKELARFIDKSNKILKEHFPINSSTVAKVKPLDIKILGSFDLGIGKLICYSDGNVELKHEGITSLGSIIELEKASLELGRNLIREGNVVSNNMGVSDIVKGVKGLNKLYLEAIDKDAETLKPKELSDNATNKSRELALCLIVTKVVKTLASGRSLAKRYRTAKDIYDELYINLYNTWIDSGEQFSMEFFEKELDKNFLKAEESEVRKEMAVV